MKNIYKITCLIIVYFSFAPIYSQINYKEGRIITAANDTVYGWIKDCGEMRNLNVCFFKKDRDSKKETFHPKDLKSYWIYGDKYYASKMVLHKSDYKNLFAEVLLKGDMKLYHVYKDDRTKFYLENDSQILIPLVNIHLVKKETIPDYNIKSIYQTEYKGDIEFYKKTLLSLCDGNSELKNQVYQLEYKQESLIEFTRQYIATYYTDKEIIEYEKDFSNSKPKYGIYIGASRVQDHEYSPSSQVTFPIGILVNFPLTKINPRLSIQPELYFSQIDIDFTRNKLAVPLLLKYQIFSNDFSPTVAIGKEAGYYFSNQHNWANRGSLILELGYHYPINSRLTLFSNIRYQHYNIQESDPNRPLEIFKANRGLKDIQELRIQMGIFL